MAVENPPPPVRHWLRCVGGCSHPCEKGSRFGLVSVCIMQVSLLETGALQFWIEWKVVIEE
eukprot:387876-Amphidinium_carterae.1